MAVIGTAIRFGAFLVMYFISNPKLLPLKTPQEAKTFEMRKLESKNYQNDPGRPALQQNKTSA
jgi:hypothetical protein